MSHDPVDLVGQAARKAEDEHQARIRRLQEKQDFLWLIKMPQFRRFVWRKLEEAGVFNTTFRPGQPDHSAFLEGRRDAGLRVLHELHEWAPEMYEVMVKEQKVYVG